MKRLKSRIYFDVDDVPVSFLHKPKKIIHSTSTGDHFTYHAIAIMDDRPMLEHFQDILKKFDALTHL